MNPKGLIWAGLYVEDMERQVRFYRDVLGLRLLRQGEGWAHFEAGGGALFELFTGGTACPTPKTPVQQPLVPGFRVDDLEQVVEELRSKGVQLTGEIGRYKNTRWAQFTDPEGNCLEIKEVLIPGSPPA